MSDEQDILTPEESNALLEASAGEPNAASAASGVREIEPEYWEQVRPDRIPAFEAINEDVAAGLEKLWAQHYKTAIVVSAEPPRTHSWRELAERTADAPCVSLIEFKTQGRRGLVILEPDTVSAMVDLYFGGAGDAPRSTSLGALTEMERRQMHRFVDAFAQTLGGAWSRYGRFEITRAAEEYEPDVAPLCAPNETVFAMLLIFALGDREHRVELALPAALVQLLKTPARPALPGSRQGPGQDWQARLREDVKGARVELRAVLGGSSIRLADLANAKPGDIIATEPLTRVCMYAGSKPVFEGTLGARGGFNAVKISQAINKRLLGDK